MKYASDFSDRHTYLGASEVAAALGMSEWTSRYELFGYKTRRLAREHKKIFDRGHDMEAVMVKLLRDDLGVEVIDEQREFVNPDLPWLVSHVDGIIPEYSPVAEAESLPASGPGVLEMKAPGSSRVRHLQNNGLDADYIFQMQTNLRNSGLNWGRFAFLDYDRYELVCFDILRDDAMMDKALPHLVRFWNAVEADQYDLIEDEEVVLAIPQVGDKTISYDDDLDDESVATLKAALFAYDAKSRATAEYEHAAEAAKLVLTAYGAKRASLDGEGTITQVATAGRESIQGKQLYDWCLNLCGIIISGDHNEAARMANNFMKEEPFKTRSAPSVSLRVKLEEGE